MLFNPLKKIAALQMQVSGLQEMIANHNRSLTDLLNGRQPDYFTPQELHWREVTLHLTLGVEASSAGEVLGDVAEFGTMSGISSVALAKAMAACDRHMGHLKPKSLWLFDSFEGLPAISEDADRNSPHVQSGSWTPGACKGVSPSELRRMTGASLPDERIRIVEGWYSETMRTLPPDTKFSLIHVDCDLYSSTRDVLDHLFATGAVSHGAYLFFDDWNCGQASPDLGERKAFTEAVAKYRIHYSDEGGYGLFSRKFIIHDYVPAGT